MTNDLKVVIIGHPFLIAILAGSKAVKTQDPAMVGSFLIATVTAITLLFLSSFARPPKEKAMSSNNPFFIFGAVFLALTLVAVIVWVEYKILSYTGFLPL